MKVNQYLVPPRLKQKYLLFGCTVLEWFLLVGALLFAMFQLNIILIIIPGLIFASSCRFINGEMNGRDFVKLLYKFYARPQLYGLRGGRQVR